MPFCKRGSLSPMLCPSASVAPVGKFCALCKRGLANMLRTSKRTSTISKPLTKPRYSRSHQLSRGLIFNKRYSQRNLFTRDVCTSPRPQLNENHEASLSEWHPLKLYRLAARLASYSTFHLSQPRPQQSPVSKAGAGAVDRGVDLHGVHNEWLAKHRPGTRLWWLISAGTTTSLYWAEPDIS